MPLSITEGIHPAITIRTLDHLDPCSELGQQWEELVRNNPASGIMQSLHWQAAKRRQGLPSMHLGVFLDQRLLGGAIFYASHHKSAASILVAPEGPVLSWADRACTTEALRLMIDAAQEHANMIGAIAMRIEPRLVPPMHPVLREFVRAPLDLVPQETLYIDLSLPAEMLLQSMKPKGRYNIKLALRHGVVVREDKTDSSVDRFYSVMKEASLRDGFALEPLAFFENLAAVLCARGCARFLFVEHAGDTLGALMLVWYGNRATYLYGGTTDTKRYLMGGYALQWAAMQAAQQEGCQIYDFYGFDAFRSPEHPYARFSQFKSQFGGTAMRFIGAQEYFFLDNLADRIIRVVNETARSTPSEVC